MIRQGAKEVRVALKQAVPKPIDPPHAELSTKPFLHVNVLAAALTLFNSSQLRHLQTTRISRRPRFLKEHLPSPALNLKNSLVKGGFPESLLIGLMAVVEFGLPGKGEWISR